MAEVSKSTKFVLFIQMFLPTEICILGLNSAQFSYNLQLFAPLVSVYTCFHSEKSRASKGNHQETW